MGRVNKSDILNSLARAGDTMQDNTPKLEKVVMEEQLDLVLKDMKKAAEREALLRAELKRSREEIEEMKLSLKYYQETIEDLTAELADYDKFQLQVLEAARSEQSPTSDYLETSLMHINKNFADANTSICKNILKYLIGLLHGLETSIVKTLTQTNIELGFHPCTPRSHRKLRSQISAELQVLHTKFTRFLERNIDQVLKELNYSLGEEEEVEDVKGASSESPLKEMSFTFSCEYPEAKEVLVTGTFNEWSKLIPLKKDTRRPGFWSMRVHFPLTTACYKFLYKFVVDGNWEANPYLPQKIDRHNNIDNIGYLQVWDPKLPEVPRSLVPSTSSSFVKMPGSSKKAIATAIKGKIFANAKSQL